MNFAGTPPNVTDVVVARFVPLKVTVDPVFAADGTTAVTVGVGVAIGMKPAGGIRTAKQSLHFLTAVKETLGDAWLTNERYRFGASSLLNDLVRQLAKEESGAYQAPYYFSEAAESY